MWLNKRLYQKLYTDIKYELEPIDSNDLSKQFVEFEKDMDMGKIVSIEIPDPELLKAKVR